MPKKKTTKSKKQEKQERKAVKAHLRGETIISNTKEALSLYNQSRFGELKSGVIYYSIYETLYLVEKGKLQVYIKTKKISLNQLLEVAKEIDKKSETKFTVFRDMRDRGYIVKTALKFGAEFRVYEKGIKPGEDHAKWILYPVHENSELTWHDFAAKNRVAHSTRKNLLIAIVDEEADVTYYEVAWKKP